MIICVFRLSLSLFRHQQWGMRSLDDVVRLRNLIKDYALCIGGQDGPNIGTTVSALKTRTMCLCHPSRTHAV